jgi:alkylation response protein AidB-like acyl-CoA dehydrogenase
MPDRELPDRVLPDTPRPATTAPDDDAAFRAYARAFLAANATKRVELGEVPAYVPREVGIDFQGRLFAAGLAGLTVPARYGGAGLTKRHLEIFNEEAADYWLPTGLYTITIGMCVPVLLEHGTEEQRMRHVARMLQGGEIWCQMFSEPGAGSDVAGLTTRAVRDGDEWVVDGQKVWTSAAHYSAFGMCVVRTDPSLPKHQGLSMLIMPLDTPGIDVRPLVLMTGDHGFNEVFFREVRIPATNLVGEVNGGWRCALSMLMNERVALGASGNSLVSGRSDVLIAAAQAAGVNDDLVLRQDLADVYIIEEVLRFVGLRVRAAIESGRAPGPEGSVAKLLGSKLVTRAASVGMSIAGPRGTARMLDDDDSLNVTKGFLHAPSMSIAGGTSEVQRNIIGERVLGLPKEPDPFHKAPFADIPKN